MGVTSRVPGGIRAGTHEHQRWRAYDAKVAHKSVRQTLRIAVGVREVTLGGYPTGRVADGKAVPSAISGEEKPATLSLSADLAPSMRHIPPKGWDDRQPTRAPQSQWWAAGLPHRAKVQLGEAAGGW